MTPSIQPEQLIFRAYGPELAEHWPVLGNMPQSGASARPEPAYGCPETRVTGRYCAMAGTCGLPNRVFREGPGGPDQTQNA